MCSLFGIIDYKNSLSGKSLRYILKILAEECEVRGTDATGISYNCLNWLHIYKKPIKASQFRYFLPDIVHTVTGHTRMTTKGNEKENRNNHPFFGKAGDTRFALAHNGVLYNDELLRKSLSLPNNKIETDSYIAVQLLEQFTTLSPDTIAYMAEQITGSFCFSILSDKNEVYLVKGSNPLHIYECNGFYIYASTKDILDRVIKRCHLKPSSIVSVSEGEILKINPDGSIERSTFIPNDSYFGLSGWTNGYYSDWYSTPSALDERLEDIIDICGYFGVDEDDIELLVEYGYSYDEIEELLYIPEELKSVAADLREYKFCDKEAVT